MKTCDFLVVGGGIAGASAAYELAAGGTVVLLEREDRPGYHSSGRSAAQFIETYGNASVRALTRASRPFYEAPPEAFAGQPLLSPRPLLFIARADQRAALAAHIAEVKPQAAALEELDGPQAEALVPVLRPGYAAAAVLEPGSSDIDVHALHQGYLAAFKRRGGELGLKAEVAGLARENGAWRIEAGGETYHAAVVINAAGAWGDELAALAGAAPVGLVPKRRTAVTFDPPAGLDPAPWPLVADVEEDFYFKSEAGRILASPADETPSPPCDAQPEELDVAIVMDRLEKATTLAPRRLAHRWAGLRSFVADKSLVIGMDDRVEGFFWLLGQGGYGFQTAPAAARAAAGLLLEGALPADIAAEGVTAEELAPTRLRS
ncbi:MAG: FAD-binding oxidoreductase [Kiloniellales bacterium]|nr:FAD-binding oxidoreductase [Kiloniellales bacterium]